MKIGRIFKVYLIRMLRLKKDPKEIALGFALGFIPNWFPTFGLGPILSLTIVKIFKGNLFSAFLGGISGTITWPFLFYLNYELGNFILHLGSDIVDLNESKIESVKLFYYKTSIIGVEFIFGAIINSIIFSMIIYFIVYIIIKKYRIFYLNLLKKKIADN